VQIIWPKTPHKQTENQKVKKNIKQCVMHQAGIEKGFSYRNKHLGF
jgi:hypothetical protein